jgi:hypothetical protein
MTNPRWIGDQNNPSRDLTDPNWISREGYHALHSRACENKQGKPISKIFISRKQEPDVCKHNMIGFHSKSNTDGFDGDFGNLVGKCLDCGSIILTHYELVDKEVLTDKEWLESLYEKRNGFRGYGWYEKESEDEK